MIAAQIHLQCVSIKPSSDIWSLSVIINNDIVIIIYHHHQNHHHQHQLDKTIRVARVTTVVSHSAIKILRWR